METRTAVVLLLSLFPDPLLARLLAGGTRAQGIVVTFNTVQQRYVFLGLSPVRPVHGSATAPAPKFSFVATTSLSRIILSSPEKSMLIAYWNRCLASDAYKSALDACGPNYPPSDIRHRFLEHLPRARHSFYSNIECVPSWCVSLHLGIRISF